jgi:acetoacetyl-CoA synthetase
MVPEVLWRPDPQKGTVSGIAEFTRYVREQRGVPVPDGDYTALHAWSVQDLDGFWSAAAEFTGCGSTSPDRGTRCGAYARR